MSDEQEPKLWVTALKLALGAIALIGFISVGLYFLSEFSGSDPGNSNGDSWGISKDSPLSIRR